jgi:hypothetical protein
LAISLMDSASGEVLCFVEVPEEEVGVFLSQSPLEAEARIYTENLQRLGKFKQVVVVRFITGFGGYDDEGKTHAKIDELAKKHLCKNGWQLDEVANRVRSGCWEYDKANGRPIGTVDQITLVRWLDEKPEQSHLPTETYDARPNIFTEEET